VPRAWSEREKRLIKKALLREGKKLFEKYGLQKTTVNEIVRAARISKGAFYTFYHSKEELYFDIMEALEQEVRVHLYSRVFQPGVPHRESFKSFLGKMIDMLTEIPVYKQITSSDYEYLMRKLPEQRVKQHKKKDESDAARYFGEWMEQGLIRKVDLESLNGLLLSFFYFVIHRDDFGDTCFEKVKEMWIDMLTVYLINEERGEETA
jgi:AcrR family transcriptional regulator